MLQGAATLLPEYGHFVLILALMLAFAQAYLPLFGAATGNRLALATARPLAVGGFVFVSIALVILTLCFLRDDFSVAYVANGSNSLLPTEYKVSAVWGGHEGSLLLWIWMLAGWTLCVAMFSKTLPQLMLARVIGVMGLISIGFLLFTLLTSNPFDRTLPNVPQDGSDLNPLLQDPGLIFHPPILYMGYVGFSVAFAFAIAALMSGKLDSAWARWSRPWTTTAWGFLTLGIALGSWWAYYELGWGGWWFWDPVENASFMPWLVGTALMHSLAVTEKRGLFKNWTILLAILAFSLSLLGTFLVRSGVLTSVHAFANDPERGVFILGFLLFVVGGSLLLYALRAPEVKSNTEFSWLSRETWLLGNNVLLVVIMATVLLGTLYPLVADALDLGKISVGPPYFNFFFLPLMGLLTILVGFAPFVLWKRTRISKLIEHVRWPALAALVVGGGLSFIADREQGLTALALIIGSWLIFTIIADISSKVRQSGVAKLSISYWGMHTAHFGVAVCILGISLNSLHSDQRDVRMEVGTKVAVANREFTFESISQVRGANYVADRAVILVAQEGADTVVLYPEKRRYFSGGNMMTEASIDAGLIDEIYVALGEKLGDQDAWAVRLHIKPFVRWIWLGSIFMALGGALAVFDKRYRKIKRVEVSPATLKEAQA